MQVTLLRSQRRYFRRAVKQAGLATTDGSIGILATGSLNAARLNRLLKAMPPGTWELVCHPGYLDPALGNIRTRLRVSRDVERIALDQILGSGKFFAAHIIDFQALRRIG
jgi:hypothetical protein